MILHFILKPEDANDSRKLSFSLLLNGKESKRNNFILSKDNQIDIDVKEIKIANIIPLVVIVYDSDSEINRIVYTDKEINDAIENNESRIEIFIPKQIVEIKYKNIVGNLINRNNNNKNFDFTGSQVIISYSVKGKDGTYEFIDGDRSITDKEGKFSLKIPNNEFLNPDNKDIQFKVRSVSGMLFDIYKIGGKVTPGNINILSVKPLENFDIVVNVPEPVIPNINPANKFPSRLKGKVVDITGKKAIKNVQLIFFYSETDNQKESQPILFLKTNGNGDFSTEYPQRNFEKQDSIYIVISLQPDKKYKIKLDEIVDNDSKSKNKTLYRLPEFIYIVLYNLENSIDNQKEDDCDCKNKSKINRFPDHSDLLADNNYTQDIGNGCVNFTTPNRSLEEFSYYSVVRTTEPEIIGLEIEQFDDYLRQTEDANNTIFPKLATRGFPYGVGLAGRKIPIPFSSGVVYKKRQSLSYKSFVDWDNTPTIYQAVTIAHGHILHYKQVYYADGYSMGDLLYSLPLAPGQKKQIAIYDWERKDTSSRQESLDYSESLDSKLERDRDIAEVQNALTEEHMKANSSASSKTSGWSAGASVSAPVGPALVGVSGGYSSQKSSSNSNAQQDASRSLSASMNQSLRDKTMQASSAVRSQRATVINTATQGETMSVTTEVIANHNHCHAITIQYFEVLRHIAIKQELADVQECLFIPLLMTPFDEDKIRRWREHLAKNLIAPPLKRADVIRGFDAVERKLTNNYSNFPDTTFADEGILDLFGELKLSFFFARPDDSTDSNNIATVNQTAWTHLSPFINRFSFGGAFGMNAVMNIFQDRTRQERDRIYFEQIVPKIAEEITNNIVFYSVRNGRFQDLKVDFTLTSNFTNNSPVKITIRRTASTPNIKRDDIDSVAIGLNQPGPDFSFPDNCKIIINSISIKYQTKNFAYFLINNQKVDNDLKFNDSVLLFAPCTPDELRNPKKEDETAITVLMQHLNENIEHYHQAIWWNMNPQRRFTLLDGIKIPDENGIPDSIRGKSVASIVENKLIGFAGNALIMPVSAGYNADPVYRIVENEEEYQTELSKLKIPVYNLLDHYQPITPIDPFRISLPTKGVFAEAVMGACNSCEKMDDSRFWKWEEHPSPDEPTAINPINTDSRYQKPIEATPSQLPQPIVNIQNAPSAPDPTGLGKAFELLGKNDLFKDITGLSENQKNALAALSENSKNITGAMSYADKALKFAKEMEISREANKDTDKKLEEIDRAFPVDGTDEEKKLNLKYKQNLFDKKYANSNEDKANIIEKSVSPEDEYIKTIAKSNKGSLTITKPDGTIVSGNHEAIVEKQNYSKKNKSEKSRAEKTFDLSTFNFDAIDANNDVTYKDIIFDVDSNKTHLILLSLLPDESIIEGILDDISEIATTDIKTDHSFLCLIQIPYDTKKFNKGVYVIEATKENNFRLLEQWKQNTNEDISIADPSVQKIFITKALLTYKNTEHIALGFSSHGAGAGKDSDKGGLLYDENKVFSYILCKEELTKIRNKFNRIFDIIFVDSCLNGNIELFYQLRSFTKVFIGSELNEQTSGTDYKAIIESMNKDLPSDAIDWSKKFIDSFFFSYYKDEEEDTLGAFNTSKIDVLTGLLCNLKELIIQNSNFDKDLFIEAVRESENIEKLDIFDIHEVVFNFEKLLPDTEVELKETCKNILNLFDEFSDSFYIRHVAPGNKEKNLWGLSIWIPKNARRYKKHKDDYKKFDFDIETKWTEFLEYLLDYKK